VADAPVAALVARADELARRWVVALILTRPLSEMPALPLEDLAGEAPALCAQLARTLDSDRQLEQMLAQDDPRTGTSPTRLRALVVSSETATDASSLVDAIEALRGVLWNAAVRELCEPSARLVGDLANRLAYVCAELLSAALAGEQRGGAVQSTGTLAPVRGRVLYSSPRTSSGGHTAVLIDERDDLTPAPVPPAGEPRVGETVAAASSAPAAERTASANERAGRRSEGTSLAEHERPTRAAGSPRPGRPRPWDTPLQAGSPGRRASDGQGMSLHEPPDRPDAVMRVTRGPVSPRDGSG
jgi:hypothetical protein